jgi:inhibitor of KinA
VLYESPRFLDAGEAALSIEFGDSVEPRINARVLALEAALQRAALPGVLETVPTYRALMIHYEPLILPRDLLVEALEALASKSDESLFAAKAHWRLPCCYDRECAEDIEEAADVLSLAPQGLAQLHASGDYRAYMYGFAPGWCYLGGLPEALVLPRRARPRGPTPPGAVLIGGGLTLVASNPMPTGWYVIGRTPERLFALDRAPPLLIEPGDRISFEPIDPATFGALEVRVARGEVVARREALA